MREHRQFITCEKHLTLQCKIEQSAFIYISPNSIVMRKGVYTGVLILVHFNTIILLLIRCVKNALP